MVELPSFQNNGTAFAVSVVGVAVAGSAHVVHTVVVNKWVEKNEKKQQQQEEEG